MLKKAGIVLIVVLVAFVAYVASRPASFRYERSGVIQAGPEAIFPYISNLRMANEWSPYEKNDPEMKKQFTGADGTAGSKIEFSGKTGEGSVEILDIVPNEAVNLRLVMTGPFVVDHRIHYRLTPEAGGGTRFSWSMTGENGFLGKLMGVLIDCEKMMGTQLEEGIQNLKTLVESKGKQG